MKIICHIAILFLSLLTLSVFAVSFGKLTRINFKQNSAQINSYNKRLLNNLARDLKKNPNDKIMLVGNTDSTVAEKDPTYNQQLAQRRVVAIERYLLRNDAIPRRKIHTSAFANVPAICNGTKNSLLARRVDILYCTAGSNCQQNFRDYEAWLLEHCDVSYNKYTGSWYVAAQFGYATLFDKPKMQELGNTRASYAVNKMDSAVNYGLETGYYFTNLGFWPHNLNIGLRYNYSNNHKVKGTITHYALLAYNYEFKVKSQSLLIVAQTDLVEWGNFAPYVELGLGLSRNNSHDYRETAVPGNSPRKSMAFDNNTTTNFSYLVGIGIRYSTARHWTFSLSDSYQDLGDTYLGQSPVKTDLTHGPKVNLKQNQLKLGIQYQF